jgi:hypothetical protein
MVVALAVAGCSRGEPRLMEPLGAATPSPQAEASASSTSQPEPSPGQSCDGFPANNIWRADVSRLPVHRSSAAYVASIGAGATMHPDFGSGLWEGSPIGIPVTVVQPGQAKVKVTFQYGRESDPGPYPIPENVAIEGGSDRHIILHDPLGCKVYELFAAQRRSDGTWRAGSGAVFDLRSNRLRPAGWTSADAAGLSIFAGLSRYAEKEINHALRITAPRTRNSYLWPARHAASSSGDASLPPMGLRLRLKAGVDTSRMPPQAREIAEAMKKYGVILADNGSPWYLSGAPDERWSNDALRALKSLRGIDFEAVDTSGLMLSKDSGECRR